MEHDASSGDFVMSMDAMTVCGWRDHFEQLIKRIGPCFGRCDLRCRAAAYVRGLLGSAQRKSCNHLPPLRILARL